MGISFTNAEKLAAISAAIDVCKRSFPKLIASGALTQRQATARLETLRAVAEDYRTSTVDHENVTKGSPSGSFTLSGRRLSNNLDEAK